MSKASVFRIQYLFKKYLDNTCSFGELEELFELIGKEENSEQVESLLKGFWSEVTIPSPEEIDYELQESRYNKLLETIQSEKKTYFFERKRPYWFLWPYAASIIIAMFTFIYFFVGKNAPSERKIAVIANPKISSYVHVVKLSDGSTVYLNKGSHLDYPARFGGRSREVYLVGEGYFDIKHDTEHPFYVYAGGVVTQVLGTAFNIKADGNNVKVTVTRGKVSVTARKKLLGVLLPNQQISYNNITRQLALNSVNAKSAILWKAPDLVMDNITLKEAVGILAERYGVSVELGDRHLDNCRFSATFLNTTQFDQVLKVLSRLNNLSVKHEADNGYTLIGPGCN